MRRYDPYQPEIIGRDMYECHNGDYVKYDDIKDDRALLKEAVELIQKHHDAHPIYDPTGLQEEDAKFLTRAKEVLK